MRKGIIGLSDTFMKLNLLFVLLFFVFITKPVMAKSASKRSKVSVQNINKRNVISQGLQVECLFDADDLTFKSYGDYTSVSMAGGMLPEDSPGTPWLPAKYISVLIPSGTEVKSVEVSYDDALIHENIEVYPVQPPSPLSKKRPPFTRKNKNAYSLDAKVPAALAEVVGHHVMR